MYSARELVDAIMEAEEFIEQGNLCRPTRFIIYDTRYYDAHNEVGDLLWIEDIEDSKTFHEQWKEMIVKKRVFQVQLALDHLKEKNDDK